MKNIFCYLYDSDEFIARNSTFLQPNTMCSNLRVRSFNEMIKNVHFKYNVTVFVQNPLSRFLNAYLANCIKKTDSSENACFGCNPGELECVVNQLKSSVNETERHADTQTLMYCNMPNIYKQAYFVKFPIDHRERSSYLGDVADILLNSEVPQEKVDFIKKTLRENFNDEMSTEENGLRREVIDNFKNNTMLLRSLMEIYREDFEIFDISNPNLEVEDIF
ncbi:unnamed protein product [Auanema sp. JU1783]|nr:unnamed protein product [Auanema sp. JU1783]